jgi:NAD(P)-dependent dehydrogenase (short-subunit alcohol dehydrogenase family)
MSDGDFRLPAAAVGARRLHDSGRSGWWMLLFGLPYAAWLVVGEGGGRVIVAIAPSAWSNRARRPNDVTWNCRRQSVRVTTTLATELGPENITVNAIAPGLTRSDAGKGLSSPDSPHMLKMRMNVVMRLEGEPDELVGALMLLASPAGAWMTGQVLHVDGGWVLRP